MGHFHIDGIGVDLKLEYYPDELRRDNIIRTKGLRLKGGLFTHQRQVDNINRRSYWDSTRSFEAVIQSENGNSCILLESSPSVWSIRNTPLLWWDICPVSLQGKCESSGGTIHTPAAGRQY